MKAICIDGIDKYGIQVIPDGCAVNITQCPIYPNGVDVDEYPIDSTGNITAWNKTRFIPTSSIDETELIKERDKILMKL